MPMSRSRRGRVMPASEPDATLLLSDVHANLQALEAVLGDYRNRYGEVYSVLVAGDSVGYGGRPNDVLDALAALPDCVIVKGNHDAAAVGEISVRDFNPVAAEAALWSKRQLSRNNATWIAGMPSIEMSADVTLCHGSPRDPMWEYLLRTDQFLASAERISTPGCVFGHTHLPFAFARGGPDIRHIRPESGECVDLRPYQNWFVNPGSVGQPRDGDPRASYAVRCFGADSSGSRNAITFHRVEYDISAAQSDILAAGLPPMLAHRLSVGR